MIDMNSIASASMGFASALAGEGAWLGVFDLLDFAAGEGKGIAIGIACASHLYVSLERTFHICSTRKVSVVGIRT